MSRRLLFRLLAAAPATDHVSDAELLRRFVATSDSAAFELIVRRHADAVWAACRRLLRCEADVEDAFQATFLALLRKARDVRTPCAGGWLHRVAVNAALKLRDRNARTSTTEPNQLGTIPTPNAGPPDAELAGAIHEELARLSERERLPVVLCDLEGLSHAEAAVALGWPVGTVSGRLSRARAKLRERLARRGLAPSGALLPALAAPPHLIPNALSLTAGAVPPAIVSLAEGVLAMTANSTWKWVAAAVVCAGALGAGGVFAFAPRVGAPVATPAVPSLAVRVHAEPPEPKQKKELSADFVAFPELDAKSAVLEDVVKKCPKLFGVKQIALLPDDTTLRKLQKERLNAALTALGVMAEAWKIVRNPQELSANQITSQTISEASQRVVEAATELYSDPKELRPWLEERVRIAKWYEKCLEGSQNALWQSNARFARLGAEIALHKLLQSK